MSDPDLVADIGGTHARFALSDGGLHSVLSLPSQDFASLADAARAYLAKVGAKPVRAAFAVAGPVGEGRVALTNLGWNFSADALGASLGMNVELINDFEAIALSVPHLQASDLMTVGPEIEGRGPVAIVGPGTGLGVAGFAHGGAIVTEGGHADFAPADDVEIGILRTLRARFGHVSWERVLSGPGLVNLHQALGGREALSPQEITARVGRDPLCAQTFERFCAILGSAAGDVALTLGARGGVLIAGGILPAMREAFAASGFRARFEAKGRFAGYLKAIPTRLIVQDHAGLIGAAASLRAMQAR
ncbi:MAG: glucokinase [Alphaproteobacteria bacterium]|nr:glucokinase [Alphaproteobacteria bacterium]